MTECKYSHKGCPTVETLENILKQNPSDESGEKVAFTLDRLYVRNCDCRGDYNGRGGYNECPTYQHLKKVWNNSGSTIKK
jgi:hypothetical protein